VRRPRRFVAFLVKHRAGVLLAGLLLFILTFPIAETSGRSVVALDAGIVALTTLVVGTLRRHEAWFWPVVASGSVVLGLLVLDKAGLRVGLAPIAASIVLFNALSSMVLLAFVMDRSAVTADKIFAAVAAYILIALTFAGMFFWVERQWEGSFLVNLASEPDGRLDWFDLFYFSVTVLTSTGFGEITPMADLARSLVVIEQVVGVMYVAFLVARLANLYPGPRQPP